MAIFDRLKGKKKNDFLEIDQNPASMGVPGPAAGQEGYYTPPATGSSNLPGYAAPASTSSAIPSPSAATPDPELARKIDSLSSKVDALKMTIDALSQRLTALEQRNQPQQQAPTPAPVQSNYSGSSAGDFFGGGQSSTPQQEPGWHY